jgi:transcriptional regulator with XRE-family HTH domain
MRITAEIGRAFRLARRSLGLSQRHVAELVGISQSALSRLEGGRSTCGIAVLAMTAAVLGLDLVVSLHPGGAPVRDAGHIRVMTRLRERLPGYFLFKSEVPVPIAGDRRAIDSLVADPPLNTGFELETRLTDAQALVRRATLKQRDTGIACMILVFPDTAANRQAVEAAGPTLRPSFPLSSRAILAALRAGTIPTANGILFV